MNALFADAPLGIVPSGYSDAVGGSSVPSEDSQVMAGASHIARQYIAREKNGRVIHSASLGSEEAYVHHPATLISSRQHPQPPPRPLHSPPQTRSGLSRLHKYHPVPCSSQSHLSSVASAESPICLAPLHAAASSSALLHPRFPSLVSQSTTLRPHQPPAHPVPCWVTRARMTLHRPRRA